MTSAVAPGSNPEVAVGSVPKLHWPPLLFLGGLWAWTIFALSGYWRDFEQYSYGYFVPPLAAYFLWRRIGLFASEHPSATVQGGGTIATWSILTALAILPLEYLRMALPASRSTVWIITLVTIVYTLAFAVQLGGKALAKKLAYPLFFFLTAAPWFSLLENNVTLGLMEYVAAVVTELLHLFGIQAKAQGTMISMAPGMLGIAEACSGIRSLQSGLMYSLAVGELFFLGAGLRISLVVLTVLCGFILNLARTFTLAYQTDLHGMEIIEKIHDKVGVATSLVLPLVVWALGRWMAGVEPEPARDAEAPAVWLRRRLVGMPMGVAWTALGLAAFLPCHVWLMVQDATIARQTTPYFNPRTNDTLNASVKVQEEIWKGLSPTSGGALRRDDPSLPMKRSDGWYFFWEPNKDNFNILWHHPERCMAGAGWEANGPKQVVDVELNGKRVQWFAFPWKGDRGQVLQLWGAWRNGAPVIGITSFHSMDGILSQLRLFSKGNSATEIVSVSLPYTGDTPPMEQAKLAIAKLFDYTGNPAK